MTPIPEASAVEAQRVVSEVCAQLHRAMATADDPMGFVRGALRTLGARLILSQVEIIGEAGASLARWIPEDGLTSRLEHDGAADAAEVDLWAFGRRAGRLVAHPGAPSSPRRGDLVEALTPVAPLLAVAIARAEDARREAELAALAALPVALAVADRSGAVRFMNPAAGRLLTTADPTGRRRTVAALFASPERATAAVERARTAGGWEGEALLRAGSAAFPAWACARSVEGAEPLVSWVFVDLRVVDDNRVASLKASHAQSIADLAAGTAHELNNPLTGVLGFAQLLLEDEHGPEARRYLQLTIEQVRRCQGVIHNLLLFGRVHPTRPARLIAADLVREAWGSGGYEWRAGHVVLRVEPAPGDPTVYIDPASGRRALFEILKNAVAAMPDGGVIHVEIRPTGMTAAPMTEILVVDQGQGMAPDVAQRATDPFFTTLEVGQGSGMGLSVALGVARQHGGDLRIDSVPWEGTAVRLILPAEGPREAP